MSETVQIPAEEWRAMRAELGAITQRLNDALALAPSIPAEAKAAHAARSAAKLRGFYWSAEFAAAIGRTKQFVSDRCAARVIKTLQGGKPFRIPLSEEARWNTIDRN